MNNWQQNFKEEFGIHFKNSPDELKFALSFIEDLLEEQRQEIVEKLKRIKLDMDVAVCDCGEPYRDSDAAVLINELLEELEST